MENFLVCEIRFGVRVQVPGENWSIEAWCDEKTVALAVLDVLHPIWVTTQRSYFSFEIPGVVECNCRVIGARRKEPVVEESKENNSSLRDRFFESHFSSKVRCAVVNSLLYQPHLKLRTIFSSTQRQSGISLKLERFLDHLLDTIHAVIVHVLKDFDWSSVSCLEQNHWFPFTGRN